MTHEPGSDAHDQAAAIHAGSVAPDHLVREAIAHIERASDATGAVVFRRFDEALVEAREVPLEAPFAGVPIFVEDLMCPVAGLPDSNGNALLESLNLRSRSSSVLVDRLRTAGFVVLGSTTTAEFGATISTETLAFGPVATPPTRAGPPEDRAVARRLQSRQVTSLWLMAMTLRDRCAYLPHFAVCWDSNPPADASTTTEIPIHGAGSLYTVVSGAQFEMLKP